MKKTDESLTIIGIGNGGCNIATEFAKIPEYKSVYRIDSEDQEIKLDNCVDIIFPKQNTPEDYEKRTPNFKKYLKNIKGDVLFIVVGGGSISLSSLSILEQLKKPRKISVLYVQPDVEFMGAEGRLKEKLVYNVFQEYARSGLFERLYIVSNNLVEKSLGGVSIISYYEKINRQIVSILHLLLTFQKMKPVTSTISDLPIGTRISTFGLADLSNKEEKMFFNLEIPTDAVYYFAYNELILQSDTSLLNQIKTMIKQKIETGIARVSYGVYATTYNNDIIICATHSSLIQK